MRTKLRDYISGRYRTFERAPKWLRRLYAVIAMCRIRLCQTELLILTPIAGFRWMEMHLCPEVDFAQSGIEVLLFPSHWDFLFKLGERQYRHHWREIWAAKLEPWQR